MGWFSECISTGTGPGGVDANKTVRQFLDAVAQRWRAGDADCESLAERLTVEMRNAVVRNVADEPIVAAREAGAQVLSDHLPITKARAREILVVSADKTIAKAPAGQELEVTLKATAEEAARVATAEAAEAAGIEIELSGPSMLTPKARFSSAIALFAALAAAIVAMVLIATIPSAPPTWAFIGTAGLGALSVIGVVIFVMGYGSVKIKLTAPGTESAGAGDGA